MICSELVTKGTRVGFDMEDGQEINAPPGYGMLHDPTGKSWARCSLLIAPFRRGGLAQEDEVPSYARAYLGRRYRPRIGDVVLPEKSLVGWDRLGRVSRIWYTRGGSKAPFRFQHPIGKKTIFSIFRGKDQATLYKKGRYYRVQLGRACVLDDRGIVHP
jgi:hypothetical protein